MNLILLALSLFCQSFQDSDTNDLRFTRVHLRNGNFIDGQLVKDTATEVLLRLKAGEMVIRRDQIDRVELVKMKSINSAAIFRPDPKQTEAQASPAGEPNRKAIETNTPEQIKKRVDMILFKFKNTPGTDDKEIPIGEIAALGEEAVVYLASRVPAFDLKTQDAIAIALINLKPTPKVVAVLEAYLAHENPSVRSVAMNVLCVSGGEAARLNYLRPLLRDADSRVRMTAVSLLGSSTDVTWFDAVQDLAIDKDREVRSRALRLLKNLSDKHALSEKLATLLAGNTSNADPEIRMESAAMIGSLGQKENWIHLTRPLTDPEAKVRAAAAQSLLNLAAPDSAEEVVRAVEREQDRWVRIYLGGLVQRLKLKKAIEPIIAWFGDSDADVKKVAEGVLQQLSGESFGQDRDKWEAWWARVKPQ
jgi:HEAT repeat protein